MTAKGHNEVVFLNRVSQLRLAEVVGAGQSGHSHQAVWTNPRAGRRRPSVIPWAAKKGNGALTGAATGPRATAGSTVSEHKRDS
jgi:hypothetical protein